MLLKQGQLNVWKLRLLLLSSDPKTHGIEVDGSSLPKWYPVPKINNGVVGYYNISIDPKMHNENYKPKVTLIFELFSFINYL